MRVKPNRAGIFLCASVAMTGFGGAALAEPCKSDADRIAEAVDSVFENADSDKDGRISRAEMIADTKRENPDAPMVAIEQSMGTFFDPVDTDKDGYISKVELAIYNLRFLDGEDGNCG